MSIWSSAFGNHFRSYSASIQLPCLLRCSIARSFWISTCSMSCSRLRLLFRQRPPTPQLPVFRSLSSDRGTTLSARSLGSHCGNAGLQPSTPIRDFHSSNRRLEPTSKPVGGTAADQDDRPASPAIILRPYQKDAVDSCLEALTSGVRRMGVSSPTGSGKTTMFMHLIPRVVDAEYQASLQGAPTSGAPSDSHASPVGTSGSTNENEKAGQAGIQRAHERRGSAKRETRPQTLIIVNGIELAAQAEAAGQRLLPEGWTVDVDQGTRKASGYADV